jgi:hypothetical protein
VDEGGSGSTNIWGRSNSRLVDTPPRTRGKLSIRARDFLRIKKNECAYCSSRGEKEIPPEMLQLKCTAIENGHETFLCNGAKRTFTSMRCLIKKFSRVIEM